MNTCNNCSGGFRFIREGDEFVGRELFKLFIESMILSEGRKFGDVRVYADKLKQGNCQNILFDYDREDDVNDICCLDVYENLCARLCQNSDDYSLNAVAITLWTYKGDYAKVLDS